MGYLGRPSHSSGNATSHRRGYRPAPPQQVRLPRGLGSLEAVLDQVAEVEEALALLRIVIQNDHALERGGSPGAEQEVKLVLLEEEGPTERRVGEPSLRAGT